MYGGAVPYFPVPAWKHWLPRDWWRLEDAVALSLDIDPNAIRGDRVVWPGQVNGAAAVPADLRQRLDVATSCTGGSLPAVLRSALSDDGGGWHVKPAEFARWALDVGWAVAVPLRDFALREPQMTSPLTEAAHTKPRRGPKPGSLKRFEDADRQLFGRIREMRRGGMSLSAACKTLADDGLIQGTGTTDSRAKRLAKAYTSECG